MIIIKMYLIIGIVFGILAGIMASLITYGEYKRHFINSKRPLKEAIKMGIFTFVFLLLLLLIIGLIIAKSNI
ncbi:MAG: hypothetical protein ACYDBX_03140 [Patescibacteria group bacterium]